MQPDDQIAEWLVRWEEAVAANQPPPGLDQLPAELRPHAREGLLLLWVLFVPEQHPDWFGGSSLLSVGAAQPSRHQHRGQKHLSHRAMVLRALGEAVRQGEASEGEGERKKPGRKRKARS
jgi:hypothetical protein